MDVHPDDRFSPAAFHPSSCRTAGVGHSDEWFPAAASSDHPDTVKPGLGGASPPLAEHCTCSLHQKMHPSLHHMVTLDSGKQAAETWKEVRSGLSARPGVVYATRNKHAPNVIPACSLTCQTSSRQGQQATSSVLCTKPLASSFSWEGCSCPITKIHLVYPQIPKHRICTSSRQNSLTGCNFSLIFCINSSSYLTTNSAF